MDAQLKKGIIDIVALATLKREDSYGYQLVQCINDIMPVSESTLYPVLRRLEAAELVTTYTKEHNTRLRKYYRITESGLKRLGDFLNDWEQMQKIYQYVKGDLPS